MPSGKPDWDNEKSLTGYLDSSDLMEVAARISGNFRFYRSGNVVFDTHFRTTDDDVIFTKQQAGDDVSFYTARTFSGQRGVKSYAIGTNTFNVIQKYVPKINSKYVGVSTFVSLGALTSLLYFQLFIYTGTTRYNTGLYFKGSTQEIYYQRGGALDNLLDSYLIGATDQDQQWLGVKVWVDVENYSYLKADIGGTEYDLSGETMQSAADTTPPNFLVRLVHINSTAFDDNVYIDSMTLTMNDPS